MASESLTLEADIMGEDVALDPGMWGDGLESGSVLELESEMMG